MTFTVIDDPGYRMSLSEKDSWNLTEPQTFFFANEQRRRPGASKRRRRGVALRWSEERS
jgi:hypothetical protein